MRWLIIPVFLATLPLSSCSSDAPAAKPACTPRKTIFCRCKTGEGGWQTCAKDGSGFDDCGPCDGSNIEEPTTQGGGNPSTDEPICGNNLKEAGEQCDDGNLSDDDGCLSDCRKAKCGDGVVHQDVEDCDDGNDIETDGCTSDCKLKAAVSEKCPGETVVVTADPGGKKIEGDFSLLQPNHEADCGGKGRDAVYAFVAPSTGEVSASIAVPVGQTYDVSVYVRHGDCDNASQQVTCANNGDGGKNESTDRFPVTKGETYYVFADSDSDNAGTFSLKIRFFPDEACDGVGGPCELDKSTKPGRCAKGTLVCSGSETLTCEPFSPQDEVCGNNEDDDCDGLVDNDCPCAHPLCEAGVSLASGCQDQSVTPADCATQICAADDFCCDPTKTWDDACVQQVASVCKSSCAKDTCAHPICKTGPALATGCDAAGCVAKICQTDGFCCGQEWDTTCVGKIKDICKIECPPS